MDDQVEDVPGYDAGFLRVRLDLPAPGVPTVLLDYIHFSVRQLPARRLAAIVGVNISGRELRPLAREGRWHLDVRIPQDQQAGADLYRNNSLDRGHLVRRLDPVWGAEETARAANQDTFTYTNAAPQVADFNQGKDLWLGLEDHVLDHADAFDARISVFTGPVFRDDDPLYRGVRIPRKFWKIAAWTNDGKLGAAGFVLDQSPMLEPAELEETAIAGSWSGPARPCRSLQAHGIPTRLSKSPGPAARSFHACCSFVALTHAFENSGPPAPRWVRGIRQHASKRGTSSMQRMPGTYRPDRRL